MWPCLVSCVVVGITNPSSFFSWLAFDNILFLYFHLIITIITSTNKMQNRRKVPSPSRLKGFHLLPPFVWNSVVVFYITCVTCFYSTHSSPVLIHLSVHTKILLLCSLLCCFEKPSPGNIITTSCSHRLNIFARRKPRKKSVTFFELDFPIKCMIIW